MPTPNRGLLTPDLIQGDEDWHVQVQADFENLDIGFTAPLVEDVDGVVTVAVGTMLAGGGGSTALGTGSTEFLQPNGIAAPDATEANRQMLVGKACTAKNLRVKLATAPGSGKSRTVTLRKNGADTLLTLSIADAATTGFNTSDEVSLAVDDVISIETTPTGTPAASLVYFAVELEQYGA